MLSKNLENSTSYDIFVYILGKARVYYTLSISRGGGGQAPEPPSWIHHCINDPCWTPFDKPNHSLYLSPNFTLCFLSQK